MIKRRLLFCGTPWTTPGCRWKTTSLLAQALHKAGVECECHLFPVGMPWNVCLHREVYTPSATVGMWVPLCKNWLEHRFGPLGGL